LWLVLLQAAQRENLRTAHQLERLLRASAGYQHIIDL